MRPQERHNEKTRPLRTTPGDLPRGNKINFMTSFSQRTTDQASPYLSRFSVLTLGVTIQAIGFDRRSKPYEAVGQGRLLVLIREDIPRIFCQ